MKISHSLFWYTFFLTTFVVTIYFFVFSDRINHYKFVQDRLPGNLLLESYKDYKNLKKQFDSYEKVYPGRVLKIHQYQNHLDNIFGKIIRFTQTNKNYIYEYKEYKNLNKKEFKNLKKIVNNVSLEGAYYLNPQHIDKVTLNLFISNETQKIFFLDYYKYIIDKEVDKYFKHKPELSYRITNDQVYLDFVSKTNLVRNFTADFLTYIVQILTPKELDSSNFLYLEKSHIWSWSSDKKFSQNNLREKILRNLSFLELNNLIATFSCPIYNLSETQTIDCRVIDDEITNKLISFYEHLKSIEIFGSKEDTDLRKKRSIFDIFLNKWIFYESYDKLKHAEVLEMMFSKEFFSSLKNISETKNLQSKSNKNYNFLYLNSLNYDLDKIKNILFLNLKEVERKKNYLEFLSFVIFSLIFSLTANVIYRSFLIKK